MRVRAQSYIWHGLMDLLHALYDAVYLSLMDYDLLIDTTDVWAQDKRKLDSRCTIAVHVRCK
jgi:hypothetical protein